MKYKYRGTTKIFKLIYFGKNGNAYFKCGHWCTDSVFIDLVDISTGLAKWENNQLKLKL
jgi:hypothetical protein